MIQPKRSFIIFLATSLCFFLGNEISPSHSFSPTAIPSLRQHRKNNIGLLQTSFSLSLISNTDGDSSNYKNALFLGTMFPNYRLRTNTFKVKPLSLSDQFGGGGSDANNWISSDDEAKEEGSDDQDEKEDWQETLKKREDGSLWSSFESSDDNDDDESSSPNSSSNIPLEDFDDGETFLDAIAAISADEIEFMNTEADRADKARQMQEWGFSSESISSTLGVAIDESLETDEGDEVLVKFQEETAESGFGMYLEEEVDLETVESHTTVAVDEETGYPIRSQMVFVDEHTCIGCYNCAMVAQSTFFMEQEHGRARVFQQWGDDDETVQIAIETCPVDCIHYIPYDELVQLEVGRRDQNINTAARLVNQGDFGGGSNGPNAFTAPPTISGNMGSRCNNCPSRGCADCPMYGVGKNPAFEKREKERDDRATRKRIREQRESTERSAEL